MPQGAQIIKTLKFVLSIVFVELHYLIKTQGKFYHETKQNYYHTQNKKRIELQTFTQSAFILL